MNEELEKLIKQYDSLLITPENDFIKQWLATTRFPYLIIKSEELNGRSDSQKNNTGRTEEE